MPPRHSRSRLIRGWLLHGLRLSLVASIFWLIHLQHVKLLQRELLRDDWAADIADVRGLLPAADQWGDPDPRTGTRSILGADGQRLGFAVQTAPQSNSIVGFSGPSNLLLVFSPDGKVIQAQILSSQDTRDHVEKVRQDPRFLTSLSGQTWGELAQHQKLDAVSGATLTSLAMRRGVIQRLGGTAPNLLFPDSPPVEWVQSVYPLATQLVPVAGRVEEFQVLDASSQPLGIVLRTTPLADDIVGYQGPTETLLCLIATNDLASPTSEMLVKRLVIGRSYDNAEYVGYVRDDWSFPEVFSELRLRELAQSDLKQLGIEGVSGATMTSVAVGNAAIKTARLHLDAPTVQAVTATPPLQWSWRDTAALCVIVLATGFGLSPWRGSRWGRTVVIVLVILFLGVINGTLISQAMLVGWARSGVPWMSALALVAITVVATATPTLCRQNVYCSHLCPHGAVQQLLLPSRSRQWQPGRRWHGLFSLLPPVLLLGCLVAAMVFPTFNLVDVEPFDAWVPFVAGWPSLLLAVGGILFSIRVPMAYCRYGCPTGIMLQILRRNGRSHLLSFSDLILAMASGLSTIAFFFWC